MRPVRSWSRHSVPFGWKESRTDHPLSVTRKTRFSPFGSATALRTSRSAAHAGLFSLRFPDITPNAQDLLESASNPKRPAVSSTH